MAKYGVRAQKIIHKTIEEFGQGKLRSGRSHQKVTNREQAVAIGISKARGQHAKVPHNRHK